uniref:Ribonucease P subunit Pop1 n=1 Tax=Tetrahymena pyriformis TaxID=5908 RepID=A8D432_TETPY|nr:ribonucease P subunit Pop1 [Tetrahymena pyriformis]
MQDNQANSEILDCIMNQQNYPNSNNANFQNRGKENILFIIQLAYQMVKKHLRRRAMSHNRYRIPSRIRNRMNVQELDVIEKTQDPIRCRKHLRKPKLLMNSYIRRSKSDKWMETHLWHAKRMRMIKYFQYKIARTPNEKGDRACYRFANHDCTVYDRSYYEFLFIQGTNLLEFLQVHLLQKDYKTVLVNQKKNFKISDPIDVYKNEQNSLIGPAQFIWKTEEELVVILHPGCVQEWIQILALQIKKLESTENEKQTALKYEHVKDNYNIFDLAGPLSLYKLHYLLTNLGLSEEEMKKIHPLVAQFSTMNDAANYPKNHVIQLNFKSNVSKKLIKPPFDFSQICVDQNPLNQDLLNQSLIDIVNYSKDVKREENSLLESIKTVKQNDYIIRFKTITRNRYTHKKKNKISKKQKTVALTQVKNDEKKKYEDMKQQQAQKLQKSEQIQEEQQEGEEVEVEDTEQQQNQEQMQIEEIKLANDLVSSDINMVIIFRNSKQHKGYGQGVTLVVNQGRGVLVWRLLSFIACKAIGLSEYNNIIEESGQKIFPNDYPLTNAYSILQKEQLEDKVTKHFMKPKGKRVNYARINSPFPLKPNFDYILSKYLESVDKIVTQQEDLQEVRIIMVGRGKPSANAYICLPEPEDFQVYQKMLQEDKSRVYSVHEESIYIKKYYLDTLKAYMKSNNSNMEVEGVQKQEKSNEIFCLIRNPTSRKYYLANLYLI